MGIMRKQSKFHLLFIPWEQRDEKYFLNYGGLNFLLFLFLPKSVNYSAQMIYVFSSEYSIFNFYT